MYVTVYLHKDMGRVYRTKSLTDYHAFLREKFQGQTWKDPKRVITDFVPGMNLRTLPIVSGGERVA